MKKSTNFGANLKLLRKSKLLSQEKLSQELGISRSKIASYESQNIEPNLTLLNSFAKYFDISIDALINNDTNTQITSTTTTETYTIQVVRKKSVMELDLSNKEVIKIFIDSNSKYHRIMEGFTALDDINNINYSSYNKQIKDLLNQILMANSNLILSISSTNI